MQHHHYIAGFAAGAAFVAAVSSPQAREAVVFYLKTMYKGIVELAYDLRQAVKQEIPKVTIYRHGGEDAHIEIS